jgi:ribonuclease P protein component
MPAPRYTLAKGSRLAEPAGFRACYDAGVFVARGPIKLFARPNELGRVRLGLSVPRRVGTAPQRNRIKRLLREAFRLMQHDWPAGYDLVIVVRPHEPLLLAEYQRALSGAMLKLHKAWQARGKPTREPPTKPERA